ncbi:hypothetical protein G7Y89_g1940 [Cudoniella acicularis]|uniref:Uncharacterized protein n=1 Tax=Cudoniella acicularis TaxID=354080 RepID=A0A8H4RW35_9HELO|nr:hypothetical protein G7Y89_g1940 [Cudoniella acicularis]
MLPWTIKHAGKGFAFGTDKFPESNGNPNEWLYTGTVDARDLRNALEKDGLDPNSHSSVASPRAHFEMTCSYKAIPIPGTGELPMEAS